MSEGKLISSLEKVLGSSTYPGTSLRSRARASRPLPVRFAHELLWMAENVARFGACGLARGIVALLREYTGWSPPRDQSSTCGPPFVSSTFPPFISSAVAGASANSPGASGATDVSMSAEMPVRARVRSPAPVKNLARVTTYGVGHQPTGTGLYPAVSPVSTVPGPSVA